MIDWVAILIFGGLILMLGAYVAAISSWRYPRSMGHFAFWIGVAAVLVGYFNMKHLP